MGTKVLFKVYVGLLTQAALSDDPGEPEEKHDAPDVKQASHLQEKSCNAYKIVKRQFFGLLAAS